MSERTAFWQTDFGTLLRWIIFLPIGFILTIILQVIPPLTVGLAKAYRPEFDFLTSIIAVIVVPVLISLGGMWLMGALMTPDLICGFIAPNNKVAAVVYGTLFCLFQGVYLLSILAGGISWIFFGYQLSFSGIIISGIAMSHKEEELSYSKRWMLRGTAWWARIRSYTSLAPSITSKR